MPGGGDREIARSKELKVLWIGDCVYLDVRGFLAPSALEDGISVWPTFIGARTQ